jgi:hypothetical protein
MKCTIIRLYTDIKKSNSTIALLAVLIFLSSISTTAFVTGNVNFFNMVYAKKLGSSSSSNDGVGGSDSTGTTTSSSPNNNGVGTSDSKKSGEGTVGGTDSSHSNNDNNNAGTSKQQQQNSNPCPAAVGGMFEGPTYIDKNGCTVPCPSTSGGNMPEGCPPQQQQSQQQGEQQQPQPQQQVPTEQQSSIANPLLASPSSQQAEGGTTTGGGGSSSSPTQNETSPLIKLNNAAPRQITVLPNQQPAQGQQPRLPTYNGKILSSTASSFMNSSISNNTLGKVPSSLTKLSK